MILQRQHDALLAELPGIRERHRLGAPELKWQQLARRGNGSAIFRAIFQTMIDHAALPFFFVMDKDYLIAAKAVETFFDPAYNHLFPMEFASAFDVKKDLAEAFMLAPELLAEFADMLRAGAEPAAGRTQGLATGFADFLDVNRAPALAETLRNFTDEELADLGSEFGAEEWLRTTLGHSLFGLIERLESFLRPKGVRIEIVHDSIVRMDDLFDSIRAMSRVPGGGDIRIVNGEIRHVGVESVDSLRLGDSKVEPFIQLADLLCGFVRTVFTKIKRNEQLDDDERAVCGDLVMLHQEFYTWDVNVPRATLEQLGTIGWTDLKQRFPS